MQWPACVLAALLSTVLVADARAGVAGLVGHIDARGAVTGYHVSYYDPSYAANRVAVTGTEDEVRLRDEGSRVSTEYGCTNVDEHEAVCRLPAGQNISPSISVGGGDDHVESALRVTVWAGPGADVVRAPGGTIAGPGDDVVVGGPGDDGMSGGEGRDVLSGGAGNDRLGDEDSDPADVDSFDGGEGRDELSYGDPEGVTVDLSTGAPSGEPGENDQFRSIEGARGGGGPDRLIGDEGPNRLDGTIGENVIEGRGGDDDIYVSDGAADRVDAGPGDDTLDFGNYFEPWEIWDEPVYPADEFTCGAGTDAVHDANYLTAIPLTCEAATWPGSSRGGAVLLRLRPRSLNLPVAIAHGPRCRRRGGCRRLITLSLPRDRGGRPPGPGALLGGIEFHVPRNSRGRRMPVRLNRSGRRVLARRGRVEVLLSLQPRYPKAQMLIELHAPRAPRR